MPADITEDVLEENICKALSLTGVHVVFQLAHLSLNEKIRQSYRQIHCCKQINSILYKCKNLDNKSQELTNLIY